MLVKTYFIINSNTENCELKISTTNKSIKFIDFGDGNSTQVDSDSIIHSYDNYSNRFEGYFESESTTLEIVGPVIEVYDLPNSLVSLRLVTNSNIDITTLTNLISFEFDIYTKQIELPSSIIIKELQNLIEVKISNTDIVDLDVKNLSKLSSLDLSHNSKLQNLNNKENLENLTYLNISFCDFTEQSQFHFEKLTNLNISNNKVSKFDFGNVLYKFDYLKTLVANNCNMTILSVSNRSISIREMYLKNNDFSLTGLNLKHLTLEKLSVSNCRLNEYNFLPAVTIVDLDLSFNDFMFLDLSSEDINLSNLSKLNLSNNLLLNSVTGLNSKIREIIVNNSPNLETLDLDNVQDLEIINISETKIKDLDIKNLSSKIQEFSVLNSQISCKDLLESDVETIDLENNNLSGRILIKNSNLKTLNLSNNNIEEIIFDGVEFQNLEEIKLRNNNIKSIRFGDKKISKFPKLLILDLSNNQIENWTQSTTNCDDLSHFPNLELLDLSNNKLQYFNLSKSINDKNSKIEISLKGCLNLNFINIGFSNSNIIYLKTLNTDNCPNLLVSNIKNVEY